MKVKTEADMLALGELFAKHATLPVVFELVGDVGAGKTTFTRGLARGFGIEEAITSPSFTISKRYALPESNGEMVHYDFYRLDDPGIMRDELAETLSNPENVVIVEWGGDVAELLPDYKMRLDFALAEDDSREIHLNDNARFIEEFWAQKAEG